MPQASLLAVDGLTKRFGGLLANDRVSLDVGRGEIVGLIGQFPIDAGRVVFDGADLTNRPPEAVARAGIAPTSAR